MHLRTIKTYITSIREFFKRYKTIDKQCLDAYLIVSPRVRPPKLNTLTEKEVEEIKQLPSKLHKNRKDFMYRDTLLILVGTLMGLRIHEAI